MKALVIVLFFSLFSFSCKQNSEKQDTGSVNVSTDTLNGGHGHVHTLGAPLTTITVPNAVANPIQFTINPGTKPVTVWCYFIGGMGMGSSISINKDNNPFSEILSDNATRQAVAVNCPVEAAAHTYTIRAFFKKDGAVPYDQVDNYGPTSNSLNCNTGLTETTFTSYIIGNPFTATIIVTDNNIFQ